MSARRDPLRRSLIGALVLMAFTFVPTASVVAVPRCFDRAATILGTDGDDEIVGTPGPDVIMSGDGIDLIDGRGGNDRICSGPRPDDVRGGAGDDRISTRGGGDSIFGGPGADYVLAGGGDVEALFGGGGDDRLFGGLGLFDDLIGGPGDDLLNGGPGQDLAQFFDAPSAVHVDIEKGFAAGHGDDRLVEVEGAVGSPFDDVLLGDDVSNFLVGGAGMDLIEARGSGTLAGRDADLVDGGEGDDTLDGGDGDDIVTFEDSPAPVTVDLALERAEGWGIDRVVSMEAIIGSEWNDTLLADDGDNALVGGLGDDVLDGRGGIDQAAYFDSLEPVVVDLAAGIATGWGTDTLVAMENVRGSAHADDLRGDDGPNRIEGGSGPDRLAGAGGDDVLLGDRDPDAADGGDGVDACEAETVTACELAPASHDSERPGGRMVAGPLGPQRDGRRLPRS